VLLTTVKIFALLETSSQISTDISEITPEIGDLINKLLYFFCASDRLILASLIFVFSCFNAISLSFLTFSRAFFASFKEISA
jgi:hypothetical protein